MVRGGTIESAEIHGPFEALVRHVWEGAWNASVTEFLAGESEETEEIRDEQSNDNRPDNVFTAPLGERQLSVEIGTIHSVKGETLRGILVLETFVYTHDLKELVEHGYLRNERPRKKPGKHLLDHIKRTYVAMTRPTDLLCLAMLDEHLSSEHRDRMSEVGWRFVDL